MLLEQCPVLCRCWRREKERETATKTEKNRWSRARVGKEEEEEEEAPNVSHTAKRQGVSAKVLQSLPGWLVQNQSFTGWLCYRREELKRAARKKIRTTIVETRGKEASSLQSSARTNSHTLTPPPPPPPPPPPLPPPPFYVRAYRHHHQFPIQKWCKKKNRKR